MLRGPTISRPLNIIDTADVVNYNTLVLNQSRAPQIINSTRKIAESLLSFEKQQLQGLSNYTVRKFVDNIYKLDVIKLKGLIRNNFYDPEIMKEVLLIMNSIVYLQPNQAGAVKSNERVKEWLKNLERIGSESAKGIAFESDLRISTDVFVIKTPRSPKEDLIHELLVGLELNSLRAYVPNFAYVFGGFKCTPPILKDILAGLPNLPLSGGKTESIPVSWCDNSNKNLVQYIIYENIAPAVSFKEYVAKCTFVQFLDKYLQVLYALRIAQELKDFGHDDLHAENVLVKTLNIGKISIPYTTELGVVEYLETDGISTIIDYGFSHLKLNNGQSIGLTGYEAFGVFYDKLSPLHDAYKLLMFCLQSMLINKNFDCFRGATKLFRFFNMTEDPVQAVNLQAKYYYMTPYNEKTISYNLTHFLSFIRNNVPEYGLIMSPSPRTKRILGCTGTDICMSDDQIINILGFNSNKVIENIFDFYDIVSRLESEGRVDHIEELLGIVNPTELLKHGIDEYNKEVIKIQDYFKVGTHTVITIQGQNPSILRVEPFRSNYKKFLIETAEINEAFQRLFLIYDCIVFLGKYFTLNIDDIIENYNLLITVYYEDLLLILGYIKADAVYLGEQNIQLLQLPELDILAKNN